MATATKKAPAKKSASSSKGKEPEKKVEEKVRLPIHRVSYSNVWKPRESDNGKDVYGYAAIFESDADLKAALRLCNAKAKKKWKEIPSDCRMPFVRYTLEWFTEEYGSKNGPKKYKEKIAKNPEYKGKIVANLKSHNRQPGVQILIKGGKKRTLDPEEKNDVKKFYSGAYATATITAFAYEHKEGGKGVSLSLQNILKLKDGDPLGGGASSAEDDFDEVDVTAEYGIDNDEMFDDDEEEESEDESEEDEGDESEEEEDEDEEE